MFLSLKDFLFHFRDLTAGARRCGSSKVCERVGCPFTVLSRRPAPFDMADNLACTYAALILNDCGSECSAEKLAAVIAASGFQVRPTLPMLYANFLAKKPIGSLIAAAQSAPVAAAAPAAGGAAPAAAAAAPAAAKKEAPKKVEEEEDGEMGFGLFD